MKIIAGACSIDQENKKEALELADIPEVWGVRCVGLKSVTSPRDFMGVDQKAYFDGDEYPPSIKIAKEIANKGKYVGLELMDIAQLDWYEDIDKMFIWNPAINQLGYPIYQTAKRAKKDWYMGLKNPKWHGDAETQVEGNPLTNGEKNWLGNAKYAELGGAKNIVMIQRGIDAPNKGSYRNIPNHAGSARLKKLGYEVWFDPSHTFGQLMRDEIVPRTIQVMGMKIDGDWLYSGLLIEVGTSQTDSFQHISIDELKTLIHALKFRYEDKMEK